MSIYQFKRLAYYSLYDYMNIKSDHKLNKNVEKFNFILIYLNCLYKHSITFL